MSVQLPQRLRTTRTPADVEQESVDGRIKGIPAGTAPFPLGEIGRHGWNVLRGDLPLPLALLRQSAMDRNSAWMRAFLRHSGALLAPHGKTTMSPQLFQRQLEDGAWGMTVATVRQLQVCRDHGIQRVLLANQLLGGPSIRYVLEELQGDPEFDFYCFVDSLEGVRVLADAVREFQLKRPLQLLVEVGFEEGRTGARAVTAALEVAREVQQNEASLVLRGVAGFEGLIQGSSQREVESRVVAFLDRMVEVAERCDAADLFGAGHVILSAGGSAFYDLVAQRFARAELREGPLVVVRSGCYITHDSRMYRDQHPHLIARSPELAGLADGPRAALEVWAYVQSRPEARRVILTLGKRDCSHDAGLPAPLRWFRPGEHAQPEPLPAGSAIVDLNDQHGFLEVPEDSPLAFGDMVMLGISHPCTTFDKWQLLPVVDDAYDVVAAVRTYF